MSNIHGFGDFNGGVGIQNSNSYSNQDDRLYQPSIYKMRTVTFVLLVINISIYILQLFAFYSYFQKNNESWGCLLITFGAFQVGKIKIEYHMNIFFFGSFFYNLIKNILQNFHIIQ